MNAILPLRLVLQPDGYVLKISSPDTVLGRHSECDVRLPLPDVSRRHCRFLFEEGVWYVYDLQSRNGIYINGKREMSKTLNDRDVIGIGGFKFQVRLGVEAIESEQRKAS